MIEILKAETEALSYIDDIYITDDNLNTHLTRVDQIVRLLVSHGYKINFKKSKIAYLNVVFLGYELSSEGKGLAPYFLQKCAALQPPKPWDRCKHC